MSTTTVVAIYFLIWWITLFAVLPFGIKSQGEDGAVIDPGTDPGAPTVHVMWWKLLWTTVVASVVFGILYFGYQNDLLPIEFLKRISTPPHR